MIVRLPVIGHDGVTRWMDYDDCKDQEDRVKRDNEHMQAFRAVWAKYTNEDG